MARRRDINDIDEDEEGQIVDYSGSGDSDDDNRSKKKLLEEAFRRRPASDLGAVDTSQPLQFSVLREDDELLVRSNQAFRGKTPVGVELPKASTHRMMLERLQELFPDMVEGVQSDLAEGGFRNVLDFMASICVAELAKILDDENLPLTHGVNWNELGRDYRCFRQQGIIYDLLDYSKRPRDDA